MCPCPSPPKGQPGAPATPTPACSLSSPGPSCWGRQLMEAWGPWLYGPFHRGRRGTLLQVSEIVSVHKTPGRVDPSVYPQTPHDQTLWGSGICLHGPGMRGRVRGLQGKAAWRCLGSRGQ